MEHRTIILLILLAAFLPAVHAQQMPDNDFNYEILHPAYPGSKGPVITIDEAHWNFHTLEGRYSPFARLLAKDGYVLRAGKEKFTRASLEQTKILSLRMPWAIRANGNCRQGRHFPRKRYTPLSSG